MTADKENDKNELVQYEMISEHAMEDAWQRSEGDLEDPKSLREFLKKVKEGLFAAVAAMKEVLSKIAQSSKQMKRSDIQLSRTQVVEEQLGTGELNPGHAINIASPAKEKVKFDPGVSTRRGGGR